MNYPDALLTWLSDIQPTFLRYTSILDLSLDRWFTRVHVGVLENVDHHDDLIVPAICGQRALSGVRVWMISCMTVYRKA